MINKSNLKDNFQPQMQTQATDKLYYASNTPCQINF